MFQTLLGTVLLVFSIYALDHMGLISDEQGMPPDTSASQQIEEQKVEQAAESKERFTDRIVRLKNEQA